MGLNWNKISDEQLKACASGCMKQTAYFVILLVSIIWLSGCKTKEFVYVNTTDTLVVHETDTVMEREVKIERKDSIVHDSTVIIRDVEGKPIYVEKWRDRYVKDYRNDSVDKYKAKYDSLLSVKQEVKEKKVVKEKKDYKGWWAFACLVALIIAYIIYKVKFPKRE